MECIYNILYSSISIVHTLHIGSLYNFGIKVWNMKIDFNTSAGGSQAINTDNENEN